MTVLHDLNGTPTRETPVISGGAFALHDEPVPGFIRQVRMGPDGVLLISQGVTVLVPISELWRLAEAVEPSFRVPQKKRSGAPASNGQANI